MNAIPPDMLAGDRPDARLMDAVGSVVREDRQELQRFLTDVRRYSLNKKPLVVLFGCLVIGELAAGQAELDLRPEQWVGLRSYAIEAAASMAAAWERTHAD